MAVHPSPSQLADRLAAPMIKCWLLLLASSLSAGAPPSGAPPSGATPSEVQPLQSDGSFGTLGNVAWEDLAGVAGVELEEQPHWTNWEEWGTCEGKFCGQTVRSRKRHCHSANGTASSACEGPARDYELCLFKQPCRRPPVEDQCRKHDTENVTYVAAYTNGYPSCDMLGCLKKDITANNPDEGRHFMSFKYENAQDGILCSPDGRHCLDGRCEAVNCPFNRTSLYQSCSTSTNESPCFVTCGTTHPTTRSRTDEEKTVLMIPSCASNITIRTKNVAVKSLAILLPNGSEAVPDPSNSVHSELTLLGAHFIFSKSARSQAEAQSLISALWDTLFVETAISESFDINDKYSDHGALEYHYAQGDACDVTAPPRETGESQEDSGIHSSALQFQIFFDNNAEPPTPDEQERRQQQNEFSTLAPDLAGQRDFASQRLRWIVLPFTKCSRSCGGGIRRAYVICGTASARVFPASFCSDREVKPDDLVESCNEDPCPARWVTGKYECSVECRGGGGGFISRPVSCRQVLANGVDVDVDQKLCTERKPLSQAACSDADCKIRYVKGRWGKCNTTCGPGFKERTVHCAEGREMVDDSFCATLPRKPSTKRECHVRDCVKWVGGEWSGCNNRCGNGFRYRELICTDANTTSGETPNIRDPADCESLSKPRVMDRCGNNQQRCPRLYKWHTGSWSACSSRCGNGGVRMREVHCSTDIRKPSTTWEVHYQTVDPKYCRNSKTLGEPPASEQACNRGVKCPGRWRKGNWSQCSATCGYGRKTRTIECTLRASDLVTSEANCDAANRKKWRTEAVCEEPLCSGPLDVTTVQCKGDSKSYHSACQWARRKHVCYLPYFKKNCCFSCGTLVQ